MSLPWLDDHQQRIDAGLQEERLGHAPLIAGPAGVGKQAFGDWLARRLLCLAPVHGQPCGECRACTLMKAGSHPDFFAVGIPEDKREIPVDSVRELSRCLQLTPSIGRHRVGLIEPAEAMNRNAANALLKTLEEPASDAWLILISHRAGDLPATIRSRCQTISVRPPEREQARNWLADACPNHDPAHRDAALALAGGAPLAARNLLDDGGLAFAHEVRDGLLALAAGRSVPEVLGSGWAEQGGVTWGWLAHWSAQCLAANLGAAPSAEADWPAVHPDRLAKLADKALRGRALALGSVRQDLSLAQWLIEWKLIAQRG
ncbi:MAG: DNA polymerase III subunit delta' [Wenzhouxiangella sp.]